MRTVHLFTMGLITLLLASTPGRTQGPGGGYGGRGGGGGGYGGGYGGGGGGGGFRGMDPNALFNQLSNGKDVINRSEITDPSQQAMFDRFAERMGVTNGQISRDQFSTYMAQRTAMRGGGGGRFGGGPPQGMGTPGGPATSGAPGGSLSSGTPGAPNGAPGFGAPGGTGAAPTPGSASANPGAPPGANPGNNQDNYANWAEGMFRRLDQNGDGYLNNDEMSDDLRSERDKWDTDHNGLIDLNEFKAYFMARMQQRMAERAAGDSGQGMDPTIILAPSEDTPTEDEDRKPVVFRAGKLPKNLPPWFQQLDTDQDGQVGLYEWRAGNRPIDEFQAMDRNNDGFLTAEEVLAYEAKNNKPGTGDTTVAAAAPAGNTTTYLLNPGGGNAGMAAAGPPGMGGYSGGGPGMGSRGDRPGRGYRGGGGRGPRGGSGMYPGGNGGSSPDGSGGGFRRRGGRGQGGQ